LNSHIYVQIAKNSEPRAYVVTSNNKIYNYLIIHFEGRCDMGSLKLLSKCGNQPTEQKPKGSRFHTPILAAYFLFFMPLTNLGCGKCSTVKTGQGQYNS
jgi:hypothetical protein